jgi:hypothetical protein
VLLTKHGPGPFRHERHEDDGDLEIFINSDGKPTKTAFNALVAAVFSF